MSDNLMGFQVNELRLKEALKESVSERVRLKESAGQGH